jgi:hypothetical protein
MASFTMGISSRDRADTSSQRVSRLGNFRSVTALINMALVVLKHPRAVFALPSRLNTMTNGKQLGFSMRYLELMCNISDRGIASRTNQPGISPNSAPTRRPGQRTRSHRPAKPAWRCAEATLARSKAFRSLMRTGLEVNRRIVQTWHFESQFSGAASVPLGARL